MTRDFALESLGSTNRSVRLNAARELNIARMDLANKLARILNSTDSDSVKVDAVIVAGRERIDQVVPYLVGHFELDDVYPRRTRGSTRTSAEEKLESDLVVSGALWQIGLPAIPALLDRIAETDETNILAKCVLVCYRIEGRELTDFRLLHFADMAADPIKKGRIQSAIHILKGLSARDIGTPGFPELLNGVSDSDPGPMTDFLISTCESIQGHEMTEFQLRALLVKETDPTKRSRIQSALDFLQKPSQER
jgi:hypothetical protein